MFKVVRFCNLKERGIVDSRAQLDNLVEKYDFPPGRMISPNARAWTEDEIDLWFASRPTDSPPPRGAAKVAKGRRPKDRQRKAADEAPATT
jgi:hypothetical protein